MSHIIYGTWSKAILVLFTILASAGCSPQVLTPQIPAHPHESQFNLIEEQSFTIAPGIGHTTRIMEDGNLREVMHITAIEPKHPDVEFMIYSSRGEALQKETVGNMIKQLLDEEVHVVAGFNGDFFNTENGVPHGLQVSHHEVITSPYRTIIALAVMSDRSVKLESNIVLQGKVSVAEDQHLPLDMVNRPLEKSHSNHAVIYTNRFGKTTGSANDGIEVVVRAIDPDYKLVAGQKLQGSVETISETSNNTIGPGQFILSASGSKANWIREHLAPGATIDLIVSFDKPLNDAKQVVSGRQPLLMDGEINSFIANDQERHPRTMLAIKEGKLYIIVVDGRSPGYSDGITLLEGAQYMKELGMEHAINLDGGGSSTFYATTSDSDGPVLVNRFSDKRERPVGNAMILISNAK